MNWHRWILALCVPVGFVAYLIYAMAKGRDE